MTKDKLIEKQKKLISLIGRKYMFQDLRGEISELESELATQKPERMTAEDYIKNNWGESWLRNEWQSGDVIVAIREYASSKRIDLNITNADIEAWTKDYFKKVTTPIDDISKLRIEIAVMACAKAALNGEIKHIDNK